MLLLRLTLYSVTTGTWLTVADVNSPIRQVARHRYWLTKVNLSAEMKWAIWAINECIIATGASGDGGLTVFTVRWAAFLMAWVTLNTGANEGMVNESNAIKL